jgi:hypothetical protein
VGGNSTAPTTVDGDSIFDPLNTTGFSGKYKLDGWRKFTAPTRNVAVISSSCFGVQAFTLYQGTCGNLFPIAYYVPPNIVPGPLMVIQPTSDCQGFHWIIENLNPGQEYFIRYGLLTSDITDNEATFRAMVYALPDQPRKIITTAQGGNFSATATWQGGIIPTPYDSIVVRDGATLTINHSHAFGHLTIGEGGAAPARFLIGNNNIQTTYLDQVHVLAGDSMCTFRTGGAPFIFTRDFRLDGIFKSNYAGQMQNITNLAFVHTKRQRVYGSGRFVRANIPGIIISNDEGLKWEIDGELWKPIYMIKGEFDHYSANIASWQYSLNFNGNGGGDYLTGAGFTRKAIPVITDVGRPNTIVTRLLTYSDIPVVNNINYDSIQPYYSAHKISSIIIEKKNSGYVQALGNVKTYFHGDTNNPRFGGASVREGIFKGGLSDTLFGNGSYQVIQRFPAYADFGVLCGSIFPSGGGGTVTRVFQGGRNGKNRHVGLTKVNFLPIPADQRFYYRLHDAPPTGQVTGDLRMLMGIHHVELASKYEFHDSIKVEYFIYDYDNIIGPLQNVRLAQAPTPQGPWKSISGPPIKPELTSEQRLLRSSKGVKLAEGAYFAIASISNLLDAKVLSVHLPGAFRFGCSGTGMVRIPLRVQNIGINTISTLVVGAKINNQVFTNLHIFNSPLGVNQIDTAWVEIPQTLNGALQAKFFTALNGDGNAANDSISVLLPFDFKPIPYRENFDTITRTTMTHRYPIILGYENIASEPPSSGLPHKGFGFGGNQNKIIGVNGWHNQPIYLATMRIGPIGASTYFSYLLSGLEQDINPPSGLLPIDTFIVEASDDCGITYKTLRKFHHNNLPVIPLFSGAPIHRFYDSLPFEPGSVVNIRFRPKGFNQPSSTSIIIIDDISLIDTLITNNAVVLDAKAHEVTAYPNPASGEVQFTGLRKPGRLIISDLQGKALINRDIKPERSVNIKQLPPGIYIWKVENNEGSFNGKLLVE